MGYGEIVEKEFEEFKESVEDLADDLAGD